MLNEAKEQNVINQFAAGPEDDLYRVERDFFLDTKLGPLVGVKKGDVVRLTKKAGVELFYGCKVRPLEISETFEVLHPIRVAVNGEWVDLDPGDVIRLEEQEGLDLLRRGDVKEKKGVIK